MDKPKVFISTSSFGQSDSSPIQRLTQAGFEITLNPYKRKLTKDETIRLYATYDCLIAGLEILDEEVLSRSSLRVVSRCGAGISNVDLEAARRLGITICSTPDAPTISVAEITVAMMVVLLRMTMVMDQEMHAGRWIKKTGLQLQGKTVLILGYGRIGRKVADLLQAFDVRLIAVDAHDSLEKSLPQADIITVHVSGEQQLIGKREIVLMKQGVYILNASRGSVVNEPALIAALQTGKVAGVWCDVFVKEPYQGPLKDFPQAILTPHIASNTRECRQMMEMQAVHNLIAAFGGRGGHGP